MKSIAFYNNKGGVGKTTSAINIAYELAKNSKVLIIDVDGQANCSRFFTEELKEGLDKALVNTEVSPETALCHTRYENIDIITATPKLNGITSEFDSFSDEEQAAIARNILSFGSAYDYVLLDLPPALTKVTERLIGACDVVFIPIERLKVVTDELNQAAIEAKKNAPKREKTCYFERAKMKRDAARLGKKPKTPKDQTKGRSKKQGIE